MVLLHTYVFQVLALTKVKIEPYFLNSTPFCRIPTGFGSRLCAASDECRPIILNLPLGSRLIDVGSVPWKRRF
jgi:hypothetical protein